MFTNLRTLFLTISEVQVSLVFCGTLNSMYEHPTTSFFTQHSLSSANNPISAFPPHPHISSHSLIPAEWAIVTIFPIQETLYFQGLPTKGYGKEPSTCAGKT